MLSTKVYNCKIIKMSVSILLIISVDLKREISPSLFSLLDLCICVQNQEWASPPRAIFLHSPINLCESWLRHLLPWLPPEQCSALTSDSVEPATKWSESEFDIVCQSVGKISIPKLQRMWLQTSIFT